MRSMESRSLKSGGWLLAGALSLALPHLALAQTIPNGSEDPTAGDRSVLSGQVTDEHNAVIIGAKVRVQGPQDLSTTTDERGNFAFSRLTVGKYSIAVAADGFAPFANKSVALASHQTTHLNVVLRIALQNEQITVLSGNALIRGAEFGGSAIILRGEGLEDLPDDPGGLEETLRALALRTGGPFGPQLLVDGFEGNPVPAKDSIREIRINDNPFSAEYPQLGLGRIEILTKPGTDSFHSDLNLQLGNAALNSRNPYATNRAPFRSLLYGGDLSGPIVQKRAAFFMDFNRQADQSNAVINATIVNPGLAITPYAQAVVTPVYQRSFGPRLDLQLNSKNTLVLRYGDNRTEAVNAGVGGFSLLSQSLNNTVATQTSQLTDTAVLGSAALVETRLQYIRNRTWQNGNDGAALLNVPGAFTGGGASIGLSYTTRDTAELRHFVTWQRGHHILKTGVQVNVIDLLNGSNQGFNGTYTFNGGLAPALGPENQVMTGPDGNPAIIPITGIESYRRTVLFENLGYDSAEIRQLGGGPSQFSLTTGRIESGVRQYEVGAFLQDDWRIHPKFALNLGIRYEHQANIHDNLDIAPRLGFAWGVDGGKGEPKTVIRGGIGIFYTRVDSQVTLRSIQLNGSNQRQFITSDPTVLESFPAVPALGLLSGSAVPQSIVQSSPQLRAPYAVHGSLAVERNLGHGISLATTYTKVRGLHLLVSRNLNAPEPGTYNPQAPGSGIYPFKNTGSVFEYESGGISDQDQILMNFVYKANKRMTLWSTYTWTNARDDTAGPESFPANSYDLQADYGRSSLVVRHSLYWGGWIRLPGAIDVTPLVIWRSGLPFNITTGVDNNGDALFLDRPAFATDLTRPSVVVTQFGAFDTSPLAGQHIIPRNYGQGPGFVIANLRMDRKIALTERVAMILSAQVQNILNHTNPGLPIGNLNSPLFGLSNASAGDWGFDSNSAGNRRLLLGLSFAF